MPPYLKVIEENTFKFIYYFKILINLLLPVYLKIFVIQIIVYIFKNIYLAQNLF